jgi:WD40 repeat protein
MSLEVRAREAGEAVRRYSDVDPRLGLDRLRRTRSRRRATRAVAAVSSLTLAAVAVLTWAGRPGDGVPQPAHRTGTTVTNGPLVGWSGGGIYVFEGQLAHLPADVAPYARSAWPDGNPQLAFSADGSELFYVSTAGQVVAFSVGTGEARTLATCPPVRDETSPPCRLAVSPDGLSVALVEDDAISITGAVESSLPLRGLVPMSIAWSPDGARLALSAVRNRPDGPDFGMYVADVTGSDLRRVPVPPAHWLTSPTWSPDGSSLAYVSTREGKHAFPMTIVTEDLDSGTTRTLADAGRCITCSGALPVVAWSPDGTTLAYTTYDGPTRLVPVNGGPSTSLGGVSAGPSLAWQPVLSD